LYPGISITGREYEFAARETAVYQTEEDWPWVIREDLMGPDEGFELGEVVPFDDIGHILSPPIPTESPPII